MTTALLQQRNNFRGLRGLGASIQFNTEPTSDWNCFDWITWHKELIAAFKAGKFASGIKYNDADAQAKAKQVFLTWWDKLNHWYGSNVWCSYKPEFFNYFKAVGLTEVLGTIPSLVTPIYGGATTVADATGDAIDDAADAADDTAELIKTVIKVLKVAVPVVIGVAVIGGGFYVYKNYIKGDRKVKVGKATV